MHDEMAYNAILIAGPTGCGKSAYALDLAEKSDGVIINADSMQVYDGLRILTARPSLEDEARAPHFLYGSVDPTIAYSTGAWRADCERLIAQLSAQYQTLIFVGGTGLYFKALTEGLSEMPQIDVSIRDYWRARLTAEGAPRLYKELQHRDAATADTLNPNDSQRIVRALEVWEATGQSFATLSAQNALQPLIEIDNPKCRAIVLAPSREMRRARIAKRYGMMVEAGVDDEVADFLKRRLDQALPAMKAIGLREIEQFQAGIMSEAEVEAAVIMQTQRYAKRQMTWFRNQLSKEWQWIAPES